MLHCSSVEDQNDEAELRFDNKVEAFGGSILDVNLWHACDVECHAGDDWN